MFKVNKKKTLEKGVKHVQVNNRNPRTSIVFLVFLLLTYNIFHTFF